MAGCELWMVADVEEQEGGFPEVLIWGIFTSEELAQQVFVEVRDELAADREDISKIEIRKCVTFDSYEEYSEVWIEYEKLPPFLGERVPIKGGQNGQEEPAEAGR